MSSPTQLTQPFLPSDPHMDEDNNQELLARDLGHSPVYDDLDFAADLPDFHYDLTLGLDLDASVPTSQPPRGPSHSKHFSVDGHLLAPFSLNAGSRFNFNHLRNISLDDTRPYPQAVSYHSHLVSVSADPPSGMFTHSASSTTLHLVDLVPQLSLLALNPLLLDSPYLAMVLTTPGRRRKSTSMSSTNLYATPLRGLNPLPSVKVGKTPMKTHRRTRLKATVEGSANLLNTIANMKSAGPMGSLHQMVTPGNPFEMAFVSPKMDSALSDYDATPLATPAKNLAGPQYFTPVSQNHSFGGSLVELSGLALLLNYLQYGLGNSHDLAVPHGYTGIPTLRRNDTLDSIKIEDQEDDACKQLRKAKSFTAMNDPVSKLTRIASLRNFKQELAPSPRHHEDGNRPFRKSASIDLLLPELMSKDSRTSSLKSYPASIDLASITNSGITQQSSQTSAASGGLLPPIAATRSSSSITSHSPSFHLLSRTPTVSRTGSGNGSSAAYPTLTQIHETAATEEIAKFAEEILNSDLKRPIIVQEEDEYDPKKKHKCPLCLARFQRPEHVKRHLKSHSNDKPFQCDFPNCDRRFNRKDNLKAHLKKIHKKVT